MRTPEDFDRQYGELLSALHATVREPDVPISVGAARSVSELLPSGNVFGSGGKLRRGLKALGLTDDDYRPLGRLKALLESDSPPTRPGSEPSREAQLARPSKALSKTEEREFNQREAVPTLYVENIPADSASRDLVQAFAPFGTLKAVRIPRDFVRGKGRGFAFIEFAEVESAKEARRTMDGEAFRGRTLRIGWARARRGDR